MSATDSDAPLLWKVAAVLNRTPKGGDESTRASLRAVRRTRTIRRIAAPVASLAAVGATIWAFVLGPMSPFFVPLMLVGAVCLGVAAGLWIALLRASAFRNLSLVVANLTVVFWWFGTVLALLASFLALTGTVLAVALPVAPPTSSDWSSENLVVVKAVLVTIAAVGVFMSSLSSASAPPLLQPARKLRHYQAHWSQIAWTFALVTATIALGGAFLNPCAPSWIAEVTIPLVVVIVAACFAWHARALVHLRTERVKLLAGLEDVWGSMQCGADSDPEFNADASIAILRLRDVVRPGPFRSQSPAAPPASADWAITEILDVGLFAVGFHEAQPESLTSRRAMGGKDGDDIRGLLALPSTQLVAEFRLFTHYCIRMLS